MKEINYFVNKKDSGKTRWDLVPWEEVEPLAEILTFGAEKYGDNTWQTIPDGPKRYKAALFRHLVAWCKGEKLDPESGLPHLAHAMCNIVFLMHFEKRDEKKNDFFSEVTKK